MSALPRRTGFVSIATLGAITLTLGMVHLVAPDWSRAAGLDVWNYDAAGAEYSAASAREGSLEETFYNLKESIQATDEVVADVTDHDLPLDEAVDAIARLNAGRQGFVEGLSAAYPNIPTHQAQIARQTIDKARLRLEPAPARWTAVSSRLEAEYRALEQ